MTDPQGPHPYLLWDMAGTLIPFDPLTGAPGVLPEADQFLAELGESHGQVVTTGDMTGNARSLLNGFGIGGHFERVFGDLYCPVGKPYGAILKTLGGDPQRSLAIGDRLRSDIASDTDQVVSLLINQDGDTVSCGLVAHIVGRLRRESEIFAEAFTTLWDQARPVAELAGPRAGGTISEGRSLDLGFPLRLMRFRHDALDGQRLIIQI